MQNFRIYLVQTEILHVVTYEWEYINIVNTGEFFLSELEEMQSGIYRAVTTTKAGMEL